MKRLVGERRAVAAAILAFYAFVYLLLAFGGAAPPGFERALAALGGVYALAFVGVVAGYFWARWYAIGVALSGVITTAVSIWQIGPEPVFLFIGGSHLAVVLTMWGDAMSSPFDGRAEWRAKFHMDEHAVHRLGRAVIRIGISLPYILLYALAPRAGAEDTLLALGTLGFAGAGVYGLFRMRTWGLVSLGGALALLLAGSVHGGIADGVDLGGCATVGATLLGLALLPFVKPVARFISSPREA